MLKFKYEIGKNEKEYVALDNLTDLKDVAKFEFANRVKDSIEKAIKEIECPIHKNSCDITITIGMAGILWDVKTECCSEDFKSILDPIVQVAGRK